MKLIRRNTTKARQLGALFSAVLLTAGVAACGDSDSASESGSASSSAQESAEGGSSTEGTWPRTVSTLDGQGNEKELKLEAQPKNIVSTSVTLTGELLALDAPVKSTGVQSKGNAIANDKGFFNQWADEAEAANLGVTYEGEANVEAILAEDPDLVVMSASGADSATAIYDQLADVVPVVVVDYSNETWTDTVKQLGEATGLEDKADEVIGNYESRVDEVKKAITAPEQPVNVVSLGQGGSTLNVWTEESAQGRLLTDLGWELAVPEEQYGGGNPQFDGRKDVVSVAAENYGPALTGKSIAAINADGKSAPSEKIKAMEQLSENEAVTNDRIYDFPATFFRIDYFSAMQTLDFIEETFK